MNLVKLAGIQFGLIFAAVSSLSAMEEREWTDSTGNYSVKGELIAYSNQKVVLQKADQELVSFDIKDLSQADKQFVMKIRSGERRFAPRDSMKTWGMQSGLKVKGQIIQFAQRAVTLQLANDRVYVNDKLFQNIPPVYQKMVPQIAGHFEKMKIEDESGLRAFLASVPGAEKTYQCEGVLLELENGDRYGIPLFFFSKLDLQSLQPAYERWAAASKNREQQDQESFYLRAQSQASQSDDIARLRQIAEIKLQLQAYDAGLYDLWEVQVIARNGQRLAVVVPGRSSDEAAQAALLKYPGTQVGSIAKVRRRR